METSIKSRFQKKYGDWVLNQHKIVDQGQPHFNQLAKQHLDSLGLCSFFCLSAVKLLASTENTPNLESSLAKLRDDELVKNTVTYFLTDRLKKLRSEYFKAHRFQFGKDTQKTNQYMRRLPDFVQICQLISLEGASSDGLVLVAVKKAPAYMHQQGQPNEEYKRKLKDLESEDRLIYYRRGQLVEADQVATTLKQNPGTCIWGITLDDNDHYVSFRIQHNVLDLFNSSDQKSLDCDMLTYIVKSLSK